MEGLIDRGHLLGTGCSALISVSEAERIIQSLKQYSLEDVGSAAWFEQQSWIEKLKLQGHHNIQSHADDFVKELLMSHDKINTLVHELLLLEVWKLKLLPHLMKHMANKVDSVTAYLLIFHEANLANLLEMVLFHEQAVEAMDEEYLLELVDWCHRQLQYLNTRAYTDAQAVERTAKDYMEQTPVEELEEKCKEVRFSVGMCSLSVARYLTDHVGALPMGIVSRMLHTNDTLMALLPLVESPPWERKRRGCTERYDGNTWKAVPPTDRFVLSGPLAQVWLAINNVVVDPRCCSKYEMDDFRRDAVLRLKRFMSDLLFDQIPVLKDLQRALDQLSLSNPNAAASNKSRLILEQVATVRSGMLQVQDWKALAKAVQRANFGSASRGLVDEHRKSLLQALEFTEHMQSASDGAGAVPDTAVRLPPVRLAIYQRVNQCMRPSFDLELLIDEDQPAVPVELQGEHGVCVHGKRWKLLARSIGATQPLPAKGRIAVCHGGQSAEALLELPAPSTKSAQDLAAMPAGIWLTVGLLAQDKLALQLRLKRTDEPKERDRTEGVWHLYHVVSGAITLLTGTAMPPAPQPQQVAVGLGLMDLD